MDTEREVTARVARAREAQRGWAGLELEERYELLKKAAKRLLASRHEIIDIVATELGKARADALFTEALGPVATLADWKRVVDRAPVGKVSLNPLAFPRKSARIELVPRGVVGIIAPWNFPVAGLYRSVFPALLLGNAVVVKPSEHSPKSSGWFLRILAEGLPDGVVSVLDGDGRVGSLLTDSDIDACVFTGSSRVGELVQRKCDERGIQCSCEMGGNDAAIVLEDADLGRTVAGLVQWGLQNAGQACGAIEVVYADSRIADALVQRLTDAVRRLSAGTVAQHSLSPLATDAQRDIVLSQIDDAVEKGAKLETGGQVEGRLVLPAVLSGCDDSMAVVEEETFGPVIPVVSVDGPADAVRRVNAGKYGLTCSLWSRDLDRARSLARGIDVGTVTINNHGVTGAMAELPWSGRRASGRGIANSAWSLLTFARPQTVLVDASTGTEPYWLPYDDTLQQLGEVLSELQLGHVRKAPMLPLLFAARKKALKAFFGL
jgi:acyl-CoA reductase-like NAD-dependent aldehyde dehydrogenase